MVDNHHPATYTRSMKPDQVIYPSLGPIPGYFGYTFCPKAFAVEVKRLKLSHEVPFTNKGASGTTHHFTDPRGNFISIVCINIDKNRNLEAHYGLLVHECMHVWQDIMERMNCRVIQGEVPAYIMQHMCQAAFEGLKNYIKKHRIKLPQ